MFEQNLKQGFIGEGEISNWLRSKGWNVLPAYEKEIGSGKGPRLFTASLGELVTPDMLIFKANEIRWIEAKTKSAFTWFRIKSCWEDGIDKRHWEHYKHVADLSRWQIWIMFLHRPGGIAKDTPEGMIPPTGLYGQVMEILRENIDHESDRHANGMVYWKIDLLRMLSGWPLTETQT